jgi:hypothetical protein
MSSGILLLIGESFRTGEQGTRIRGHPSSYESQIEACQSHIEFMNKFSNINWKIILFTYTTQYDQDLKKLYSPYHSDFLEHPVGYNTLFEISKNYVKQLKYDFILVSRIDLKFKPKFSTVFNPQWRTIRYPFICWKKCCTTKKFYPRVSDTMVFIPKKYNLSPITLTHDSWAELCERGFLYSDIDVMISTYHDSDSSKDYNPLYTIVNRRVTTQWHSQNAQFDKKKQFMESHKLFLAIGPTPYIISPYW